MLYDYYSFADTAEYRNLFGADFSGTLLGLGIWGEGAYNTLEYSDHATQFLIGLDYTFQSGLYLISEYYHNGFGKSRKADYNMNDWMRLLGTDGVNLGREYLFLGESLPVFELWNWANYLIVNLNDRSGVFFPWLDYNLSDNAELVLVGYLPFGNSSSEYGAFGFGGFVRIRIYF